MRMIKKPLVSTLEYRTISANNLMLMLNPKRLLNEYPISSRFSVNFSVNFSRWFFDEKQNVVSSIVIVYGESSNLYTIPFRVIILKIRRAVNDNRPPVLLSYLKSTSKVKSLRSLLVICLTTSGNGVSHDGAPNTWMIFLIAL